MSEKHISREEWTAVFSQPRGRDAQAALRSRILAHVSVCPACAAVYEKGRNAQEALKWYERSVRGGRGEYPDGAYQAVASHGAGTNKQPASGSLSVDLDIQDGQAVFLEETLDTLGLANKYAMNLEDGGRRLEDDGGSLTIWTENGTLRLYYADGAVRPSAKLITDAGEIPLVFTENEARAPLPPDDYCTLDIAFTQ